MLKHMDLKYYFLKEVVKQGKLRVEYCPTDAMIADIFTKGLGKVKFTKFATMLGIADLKSTSQEGDLNNDLDSQRTDTAQRNEYLNNDLDSQRTDTAQRNESQRND